MLNYYMQLKMLQSFNIQRIKTIYQKKILFRSDYKKTLLSKTKPNYYLIMSSIA